MTDHLIQYERANRERYLAELQEWLRIPSVSTLPEHAQDVRRAAEWAAAKLRQMGFSIVRIDETPRHPLVYAEHSGLDAPTLLIYGHLDVQPVDPLEEWVRPPFEPTVDGDNLYARGASDDKGQAFAILAALESCLRTDKELPVNVKILLEGEEEISSPNLFPYMRKYAAELAAAMSVVNNKLDLVRTLPNSRCIGRWIEHARSLPVVVTP